MTPKKFSLIKYITASVKLCQHFHLERCLVSHYRVFVLPRSLHIEHYLAVHYRFCQALFTKITSSQTHRLNSDRNGCVPTSTKGCNGISRWPPLHITVYICGFASFPCIFESWFCLETRNNINSTRQISNQME